MTTKTDWPVTPKSCSELCRGNLSSGMWPAIPKDRGVCVVLMGIAGTNQNGSSQQQFIPFKLSRDS